MSINKPIHRNYRSIISGPNSGYSNWAYIVDPEYANSPQHYIRAFLLIQNDLQKLFEYIEPSDEGLTAFSYRIHELFMRTCIELEANLKAILSENTYKKNSKDFNMSDYKKINVTHHLSSYKAMLPIWHGERKVFRPFASWAEKGSLPWYNAYNASKHGRQKEFKQANLGNLLESVAALLILLSSQFRNEDFSPSDGSLSLGASKFSEMSEAIGGYFRIGFPTDWSDDEKYDFNWSKLEKEEHRFNRFNYDTMQLEISDE